MRRVKIIAAALGAAILSGLAVSPAAADAIDGTWCAVDGRIMQIKGPAITTPGGTETIGNYGRHSFSYEVPDGESGAGATVHMVLMNDNIVHLKVGNQAGEAEVWQRCETVS